MFWKIKAYFSSVSRESVTKPSATHPSICSCTLWKPIVTVCIHIFSIKSQIITYLYATQGWCHIRHILNQTLCLLSFSSESPRVFIYLQKSFFSCNKIHVFLWFQGNKISPWLFYNVLVFSQEVFQRSSLFNLGIVPLCNLEIKFCIPGSTTPTHTLQSLFLLLRTGLEILAFCPGSWRNELFIKI